MPVCWPEHPDQPDHGGEHRERHHGLEVRHPDAGPRQPRAPAPARHWRPGRAAPCPAPSAANTASACAAGQRDGQAQRGAHERRRAGRGHGHRQHAGQQRIDQRVAQRAATASRAGQHRAELEHARPGSAPISVNSAASAATTAGDCSWKPQPSCSPPARSTSSSAASADERQHDAGGVGQAAGEQRAAVVRMAGKAQHLERQHREHAGHQVQQRAADQREAASARPKPSAGVGGNAAAAGGASSAPDDAGAAIAGHGAGNREADLHAGRQPGMLDQHGMHAGRALAALRSRAAPAPAKCRRPSAHHGVRGVVDDARRSPGRSPAPGPASAAGRPADRDAQGLRVVDQFGARLRAWPRAAACAASAAANSARVAARWRPAPARSARTRPAAGMQTSLHTSHCGAAASPRGCRR